MAKKTEKWTYVLAFAGAVCMCLVVYWMYTDSVKSNQQAKARKVEESMLAPVPPHEGLGLSKLTGVFKEILDNPMQGRVVKKSTAPHAAPIMNIHGEEVTVNEPVQDKENKGFYNLVP